MAEIVVGVDGSQHARNALAWALEEGKLRGAGVRAIAVLPMPQSLGWEMGMPDPYPESEVAAIGQQVRDQAGELDVDVDGVDLDVDVRIGQPAQEIVTAAQRADLVVVGRRGMNAFAKAIVGSVSSHVISNAPCPVVVVRE